MCYVAFARPNPLRVSNRASGLHKCEGPYTGTYDLPAGHDVLATPARNRALKLDPSKPGRVVEVAITGSISLVAGVLADPGNPHCEDLGGFGRWKGTRNSFEL